MIAFLDNCELNFLLKNSNLCLKLNEITLISLAVSQCNFYVSYFFSIFICSSQIHAKYYERRKLVQFFRLKIFFNFNFCTEMNNKIKFVRRRFRFKKKVTALSFCNCTTFSPMKPFSLLWRTQEMTESNELCDW